MRRSPVPLSQEVHVKLTLNGLKRLQDRTREAGGVTPYHIKGLKFKFRSLALMFDLLLNRPQDMVKYSIKDLISGDVYYADIP